MSQRFSDRVAEDASAVPEVLDNPILLVVFPYTYWILLIFGDIPVRVLIILYGLFLAYLSVATLINLVNGNFTGLPSVALVFVAGVLTLISLLTTLRVGKANYVFGGRK